VILSGCNQWDLVLGTDCDNAPISELEVRVLRLVLQLGVDFEQLAQVELMLRYGQQQCRPHIWNIGGQ